MSLLSCDWFLMNNISAWEKRDEWNFSHNTYFLENAIKIIVMSFAQTRKNLTRALLILQYMHTSTNTKSLAKEFSKILIDEYFVHLKTGFNVFFDADSESPRMT